MMVQRSFSLIGNEICGALVVVVVIVIVVVVKVLCSLLWKVVFSCLDRYLGEKNASYILKYSVADRWPE